MLRKFHEIFHLYPWPVVIGSHLPSRDNPRTKGDESQFRPTNISSIVSMPLVIVPLRAKYIKYIIRGQGEFNPIRPLADDAIERSPRLGHHSSETSCLGLVDPAVTGLFGLNRHRCIFHVRRGRIYVAWLMRVPHQRRADGGPFVAQRSLFVTERLPSGQVIIHEDSRWRLAFTYSRATGNSLTTLVKLRED